MKTSEGIYLTQFSAEIYWADNTKIVRNITFILIIIEADLRS